MPHWLSPHIDAIDPAAASEACRCPRQAEGQAEGWAGGRAVGVRQLSQQRGVPGCRQTAWVLIQAPHSSFSDAAGKGEAAPPPLPAATASAAAGGTAPAGSRSRPSRCYSCCKHHFHRVSAFPSLSSRAADVQLRQQLRKALSRRRTRIQEVADRSTGTGEGERGLGLAGDHGSTCVACSCSGCCCSSDLKSKISSRRACGGP